jgi:hypothetical protein
VEEAAGAEAAAVAVVAAAEVVVVEEEEEEAEEVEEEEVAAAAVVAAEEVAAAAAVAEAVVVEAVQAVAGVGARRLDRGPCQASPAWSASSKPTPRRGGSMLGRRRAVGTRRRSWTLDRQSRSRRKPSRTNAHACHNAARRSGSSSASRSIPHASRRSSLR